MATDRVLLVDDEPEFSEILGRRIESRGVQVDIAKSGVEALAKAEEHPYDAIILDLLMPQMDGMETLKKLLQQNPDLQIILLTGHATLQKGVEAIKFGAADFLEKPAEIQRLMDKIKQAKAKTAVLVEKRMEERMKDIWGSKSW